jgi:hypothetical protein
LGGVSELADEHDLGSCAERLEGSSPSFPTKIFYTSIRLEFSPHSKKTIIGNKSLLGLISLIVLQIFFEKW